MSDDQKKFAIVAALLAGAVLAGAMEFVPQSPTPPAGDLLLRGKFVGPSAAEDAAAFAGLCHGIASALVVDGTASSPRIVTGSQLEDLRVAASEGRFLPRSLSREQPHAVAVAGRYLDETVGTSGGPLAADTRAKWAAAFESLASAAEEAVQ